MKIRISIGETTFTAKLYDNATAQAIYNVLPLELPFSRWGDEIYFSIPAPLDLEESQEIVEVGDLAYWPPGNAFCIFYGKTPASTDEQPRAASAVTVFGKIEGDATQLRDIEGDTIKVEPLEEE